MDDPQTEADARDTIRLGVWGGFDTAEQIVRGVSERLAGDGHTVDVAEVQAWVDEAMADHRDAQTTWAAETDCDRLDAAFVDLQRQGVLCLHDAGYTKQDGWADVAQAYADAGGPQSGIVGYCFYHRQDLERVIDGGDLFLAYGSVDSDINSGTDAKDVAGVAVGRQVRAAVERQGFTVRWDGTLAERIAVTDLVWQRRR